MPLILEIKALEAATPVLSLLERLNATARVLIGSFHDAALAPFAQAGLPVAGATAALRKPARYGGVVIFSGGLIGPPGTRWPEEGGFAGAPVFLGCSDTDSHVPEARVRESAAVFERM